MVILEEILQDGKRVKIVSMNKHLVRYLMEHPEALDLPIVGNLEEIPEDIVLDYWHPFDAPADYGFTVAGADGSYNHREYVDRILFVSMGLGMFFDNRGNVVEDFEPLIQAPEISLISTGYREEYFSLVMTTLELRSLLRIAKKYSPQLILIDGSLRNLITRHAPSSMWFGKPTQSTPEDFVDAMKDFDPEGRGLLSRRIAGDDPASFSMALYIEYLSTLKELFTSTDAIIAGISKTTTSYAVKIISELNVPDIILFSYMTQGKGYSRGEFYILEEEGEEGYKWLLPSRFEVLKRIPIYHMYVRLEENHRVYRVEVISPSGEVDVERLITMLQNTSAQGYPLPLRIAHQEVRITAEDMDIIERLLIERGLSLQRSREGL